MKCLKCGTNHLYRERTSGKCSGCGQKFVFEPKRGDPYTDGLFNKALQNVSSTHTIAYQPKQLYYELARMRLRKPGSLNSKLGSVIGVGAIGTFLLFFMTLFWLSNFGFSGIYALALGAYFLILGGLMRWVWVKTDPQLITLEYSKFQGSLAKWRQVHDKTTAQALKPPAAQLASGREKDLHDYAVERAIICDYPEIVDFLLANNFHVEQKCALLTLGGYPSNRFEDIRQMLKRNPALNVFVLHNASANGCRLHHQLITDRNWFPGSERVFDIGLHPRHAKALKGLWQKADNPSPEPIPGYSAEDMQWLATYKLELMAIRPEHLLNRLRNVLNGHTRSLADAYAKGDSDSGSTGGDMMLVSSDYGGGDDDFG